MSLPVGESSYFYWAAIFYVPDICHLGMLVHISTQFILGDSFRRNSFCEPMKCYYPVNSRVITPTFLWLAYFFCIQPLFFITFPTVNLLNYQMKLLRDYHFLYFYSVLISREHICFSFIYFTNSFLEKWIMQWIYDLVAGAMNVCFPFLHVVQHVWLRLIF